MNVLTAQIESRHYGQLTVAALLALACATFFLHPFVLLLFVCLFAIVNPTKDFKWMFLIAVCVLFTMMNIPKQFDDDLITYVTLQDYMTQKPFWTLFNKDELRVISGTYRATEIGFYGPLWALGKILPDSSADVALLATVGIYVPTFLALDLISKSEKWSTGFLLTVAFFTFFAGMNFLQSTHLTRQYISGSLFFYSFALYLSNRHKASLLVALYACTVHNGTAPLAPTVAVACWLFQYRGGKRYSFIGFTLRFILMLGVVAAMMTAVPLLTGDIFKGDVPNIKIGHFVVVGVLFIVAHIAIQKQALHMKSLYYARIAFLAIYILSIGFFAFGLTLFALRYFAYLEWLYGLMVGAIMFSLFNDRPRLRVLARLSLALAAVAIFTARVTVTEFMYGPGDNYFLSWDFFQVIQLVSR